MYEFWYDYLKPKYGKKSKLLYGYRQIQMIHCIHKNMIFTKILQKMLKQDLTRQIMNQNAIPLKGCYQKEKIKT